MDGSAFEGLSIGQSASVSTVVSQDMIERFAQLSGDMNPLHLDPEFAATTIFGRPIAHGLLTASFITSVLGNQLPGPGSIYLEQTFRFSRPVYAGDEVTATVQVLALEPERNRVKVSTECFVGGVCVLSGEAKLKVP